MHQMRPKRHIGFKLFISLLISCSLIYSHLSYAHGNETTTSDNTQSIDSLIKEILLNEIKLARFNLNYRLEAAKQGRFKGIRYFLMQEANSALTMSGLTVTVAERMAHIHGDEHRHLHPGALRHANVLAGVGQILGASGSMFEFVTNGYHSYIAWRKGFSPAKGIKYVDHLVTEIDSQLVTMQSLAEKENETGNKTSLVHLSEYKILVDIRDLLVNEFNSFHVSARRSLWTQQSFYILDTAKNVTGALGNLYGYKALARRHRIFNQPAGVLVTISGAFIIANPILSRLIGKAAAKLDGYSLKRSGLGKTNTSLAKLQLDNDELKDNCKKYKDSETNILSSLDRADLYESHEQRFTKQLDIANKEISRGNRVAVQNILSGLFIGGTKLANGIMFIEAGYKYYNDPRMTNVMLGVGAIPYLAGSSYSVADNLRIQVMREIDTYRLKKKHELPGQLIHSQLNELDVLEKSVQAMIN